MKQKFAQLKVEIDEAEARTEQSEYDKKLVEQRVEEVSKQLTDGCRDKRCVISEVCTCCGYGVSSCAVRVMRENGLSLGGRLAYK